MKSLPEDRKQKAVGADVPAYYGDGEGVESPTMPHPDSSVAMINNIKDMQLIYSLMYNIN